MNSIFSKWILTDMHVCMCVFSEWRLTGNGSYEVMCWTAEKETFAALLEYSEWLPGGLFLLCTALWKVVNLCHLGAIGCAYCCLLCVCGIWNTQSVTQPPWMIHGWVFLSSFVGRISAVRCLYPSTSFLLWETFASMVPHLHYSFTAVKLPTCLSLSCSYSCQIL